MAEIPAWLKRMEDGAIGEARARAFLADRFWILDRSVDMTGADYLIQRRLTDRNFLDERPPRLGVIQAKFLQDGRTIHYIDSAYVLDKSGVAHGEFFVLLHSGRENEQRLFLLSAADIAADFTLLSPDRANAGKFSISGATLLATRRYEVLDTKRALDRIEHALEAADLSNNRQYLGTAFYSFASPAIEHIHDDYQVPLDTENYYGDLREAFFDYKKGVQRTLLDLEEVARALAKIVESPDPLEALDIYETHVSQHVGYYGLQFSRRDLCDEDFFAAAMRHKNKLTRLRQLGLEGPYLRLRAEYWKWVRADLCRQSPIGSGASYTVDIRFHPATLEHCSFSAVLSGCEVPLRTAGADDDAAALVAPGHLRIVYGVPGCIPRPGTTGSDDEVARAVNDLEWSFVEPFVSAMERLVFGLP
jgi:hypothetical protein